MLNRLRVITRRSDLALLQASLIINPLLSSRLGKQKISIELIPNDTIGDLHKTDAPIGIASTPVANNKKQWVQDLEDALISDKADVAIHSAKDYPSDITAGTILIPILTREDPRDVFVSLDGRDFSNLPKGSRIGTNSKRRQAQIKVLRPDVEVVPYKGNVMSRLRQEEMVKANVDGIILANAGLVRLEKLAEGLIDSRKTRIFSIDEVVPASNQGILLAQCRDGDTRTRELIETLCVPETTAMWQAERSVLDTLGADCDHPLAVNATCAERSLTINAIAFAMQGTEVIAKSANGAVGDANQLGHGLGAVLKSEIQRKRIWG